MVGSSPMVIHGLAGLHEAAGTELGVSEWYQVTQETIDAFAATTGDRNPIHIDPEYAASTQFGGTIAHGLFTLSLGPMFNYSLFDVVDLREPVNYGYDRVRFPSPLPIPSRVRMRLTLERVEEAGGGARAALTQTFEREQGERPVCVTSFLLRYLG